MYEATIKTSKGEYKAQHQDNREAARLAAHKAYGLPNFYQAYTIEEINGGPSCAIYLRYPFNISEPPERLNNAIVYKIPDVEEE